MKQKKKKEKKGGFLRFLSTLLGTFGACLLGNMLAGKGINTAGDEIIRTGYRSKRSLIKSF